MFTGRGIPRIFCEDCLERLDEIGQQWENLNYYKIKDNVNA
jgi:hypothetical protein